MSNALPLPCAEAAPDTRARDTPDDRFDPRGTLTAAIVASSLAFVLGSIINVALPRMQADFAVDAAGAQWIVNAYLLPLGALVLMGGALGDHYGRRRIFLVGLAVFGLSCALCAVAWSFPVLLAARALEGIGAAMIAPTSLAILADAFTGRERGRAIGTWAAAGAAAGALAPVAGGWIVDVAGWRWAFVAVLPFAALAFAMGLRSVRESRADAADCAPLDWWGAALVSAGLLAAIWALIAWPAEGASARVIVAAILGIVLIAGFLRVEAARGDRAMLPLQLFTDRAFTGLTLFTLGLYAALGGLLLLLPYVLIQALGFSATAAGLAILPFPAILSLLSRYTGGALTDRFGARMMLTAGAALVALGFVLFARVPSQDVTYLRDILPGLVVLALGMALAVAPLTSAVLSAAGEARSGIASGVNNATSRIGGLVATALLGGVLAGDLLAGFALAAWFGAGLAAAAAAMALTMVPDRG
ncbi:MFS transporter [Jannaschia sp. S6380]|uniref:MFS transporter n=1 Tax=Jannaschia sp. S6380 TaxID=2926408 RepID=UPI001FF410A0|nr:MFS transporter [Jannaschia sp. S6380]MCK0167735.1 MFS transporter [Jannaschia sp. S6380]